MKKKRWIAILLSFALLFSLSPVPVLATDGTLTKDDSGYYEIYDAADLQAYADLVNNGETNANGRLMNDISLSGVCGDGIGSWTPIGNNFAYQFAGIFDGQGYTIMDLYIDTTLDVQGLFSIVGSGGTVKNVTVAGTVTGSASIGGVVGFVFPGGTVENCTNTGKVTCTDDVSGVVGGVVGNNFGGTVTNCSNTGEVKGTRWGGGVVGQNNYSGTVTNCYNTGTVTVEAIGTVQPGELGNVTAGGVVGGNWASVANCYSIGQVAGEYYGGGVVGGNGDGGSVQNCYFLEDGTLTGIGITTGGTVEGVESKDANAFASGEVAWLLNNRSEDGIWHQNLAGCLPTNSPAVDAYPVPDITHLQVKEAASGYTNTLVTDDAGVYLIYSGPQLYVFAQLVNGGEGDANGRLMNDITLSDVCGDGIGSWPLIGKNGNYPFTGTFDGQGYTIMDLYINSSASYVGLFGAVRSGGTVKNVIVAGAVTGTGESNLGPYIGGVVGDNDGTVTNCINTVTVTGTGKYSFVGGVVGNNGGTVENCTNTGIVTGAGNYESVGGVVGWNDRDGTVKNCTITGTVTGTGSGVYVGGVVSLNYGTVENCYFLQGTADSGVKRNLSGGTVRNVESKDADTFAGGEVAWLLQEKQETQEPLIWGQKLGEDPTPVLTVFLLEGDAAGYAVYRVEFVMGDAAEGTSPVDTCYVNSGGTVSLPEAPEGYSGWYVDANTRFTSETEVTENLSVFTKKMEDMPNVSIDYANEELTGFADDAKYTINGSEVTPVNGTLSVAEAYLGTTISIVRTAHEDSFADSAPQSLEIPARRVISAVGSEGETIIGYQDGKITGLTKGETYQLSIDGGTSWETKTADDSGSIIGLAPGTYQIRLPATTTDFTGLPTEVTIAEGGPAYTVTIPAGVTIDGTATISANNVNVAEGYSLNVTLTGAGTDGTGTAFTLALKDHETETLAYTVTKSGGADVSIGGSPVLSVEGGPANKSGSSVLTFALADTSVARYSGIYSGTVTFTVSVDPKSNGDGTP